MLSKSEGPISTSAARHGIRLDDLRFRTFRASARERNLAVVGFALLCMASISQLAMGAAPIPVLLALVSSVCALYVFLLLGSANTASWFVAFYAASNVSVALLAKTVLLQPLDSFLQSPELSFSVVVIGTFELLLAAIAVSVLPIGRPIFQRTRDPSMLRRISWMTFIAGASCWALNRHFLDKSGGDFGGLAIFRNLLLMGIIARTALVLEMSSDARSVDGVLLGMLTVSVVLGFFDDQKTQVGLPVVAYFVTTGIYRRRFTWKQIVGGIMAGAAFVTVLAPAIHAYRAAGIQKLPVDKRVQLLLDGGKQILKSGGLERIERLTDVQFSNAYFNYFGPNGAHQAILGRFASVQQVDPVVAAVQARGTLGGDVIWSATNRLLPRIVVPDKPQFPAAYDILLRLGLITVQGGKFPVVPLIAQAYAGYGTTGLLTIPLLAFFAILMALKKLGWTLQRNVYAIFFFCCFILVYAGQGSLEQYLGAAFRFFPCLAAAVLAFAKIPSFRSKRLRQRILPLRQIESRWPLPSAAYELPPTET